MNPIGIHFPTFLGATKILQDKDGKDSLEVRNFFKKI